MQYQAPSYTEPRVSPQAATPPSSAPEEKRVIVPAGESVTHSSVRITTNSGTQQQLSGDVHVHAVLLLSKQRLQMSHSRLWDEMTSGLRRGAKSKV